ncbi:MAG: DUF63 family protein [Halanaeroarchaeum sp.]
MAFPETDAERAWTAVVVGIVTVLVVGSLLFRDVVYGGFIWQYFWGPVFTDAHSAACAAWNGGAPQTFASTSACQGLSGPVAYPGYTLVSEVGYAITLIVALTGLVFLLRRLDVGDDVSFIYPLLPFVFFGGALRVVEDAMDNIPTGFEAAIQYPWNALIISPFIYFTVFFITLAALIGSVSLSRSGRTETYEWPLAGIGSAVLAITVGYLLYLAATTEFVAFHPVFTVLTLGFATAIAVGLWYAIRSRFEWIASGTPRFGAVVLFAHSVDGVSNVLGIDWGAELGLPWDLVPKHPVNRLIIDVGQAVIPESVGQVIGTAWPFLLVKLAAALFVLSLFDREMIEESPRFSVLLLLAVVAVGLGPGTRDMLRATFGI